MQLFQKMLMREDAGGRSMGFPSQYWMEESGLFYGMNNGDNRVDETLDRPHAKNQETIWGHGKFEVITEYPRRDFSVGSCSPDIRAKGLGERPKYRNVSKPQICWFWTAALVRVSFRYFSVARCICFPSEHIRDVVREKLRVIHRSDTSR